MYLMLLKIHQIRGIFSWFLEGQSPELNRRFCHRFQVGIFCHRFQVRVVIISSSNSGFPISFLFHSVIFSVHRFLLRARNRRAASLILTALYRSPAVRNSMNVSLLRLVIMVVSALALRDGRSGRTVLQYREIQRQGRTVLQCREIQRHFRRTPWHQAAFCICRRSSTEPRSPRF